MVSSYSTAVIGRRGRLEVARPASLVLLVLSLVVLPWVPAVVSSDDPGLPPGDPSIGRTDFHQIMVLQGDDPDTTEAEPRNLVVVSERTFWRVPWDSHVVYTHIPAKAENVFVDQVEAFEHQGQTFFIPGEFSTDANPHAPPGFGRMGEGVYAGMAYWSFPEEADRSERSGISFASVEDWEDMDTDLTAREDWLIAFDSLSLEENVTGATYTSKRYTGGQDIISVNMTVTGEHKENMTFQVSWDNGTTWHPIVEGEPLPAVGEGTEFRWRVSMTQNNTLDINPIIDEATFEIRFLPFYTEIWLETTYHFRVPSQGSAGFDMLFPFDGNFSGLILVGYFDDDMVLEVEGTSVTGDPDDEHPGRTTYLHMQGAYDKVLVFTITDTREPEDRGLATWVWFAVPMVLILLVAVAFVLRSGDRGPDGTHGEVADLGDDEAVEDDDGDDTGPSERDRLERMKAEILEGISELDRQHDEGQLDDEGHSVQRAELKAEAVEVMRQLEKGD